MVLGIQEVGARQGAAGEDQLKNLQELLGMYAAISYAAGAANVLTATIQMKDASGNNLDKMVNLEVHVSDDADGSGLTATAASGALAATTGVVLTVLTAKKHVLATTDATGKLVFTLTDTAKTQGERFVVTHPVTRELMVGRASVTADYGA